MAKEKKQNKIEPKIILEREYIVPLRKGWLKVPKYKRAKKAVKTLKEFIARHMKLYDNDLRNIKIDIDLNNEIRFRGMKKPPAKIKVKAKKFEDNKVKVELVDIPANVKFDRLRREKKKIKSEKKIKSDKVKEEKLEQPKESKETKEKENASKEETQNIAKHQAKEMKHVSKEKNQMTEKRERANLQR